jgi:hypothetical protein
MREEAVVVQRHPVLGVLVQAEQVVVETVDMKTHPLLQQPQVVQIPVVVAVALEVILARLVAQEL